MTDARVNVVVQDLYKKFPDVKALAEADVDEIEEIVRPCGLGMSKARDISACMKILWEQYHGNVPDDFDALLKLPGVGRKSAISTFFGSLIPSTRPILFVRRMQWVSVTIAGFPKTSPMMRFALFLPTPGSFKSASKSSGTFQ